MKLFLKFFLSILSILLLIIIFLNYVGLETDKFDSLIKKRTNTVNKNIKIKFNKTKIYLDVLDLKLLVKLQSPKLVLKKNEINLSKLDLFLSLKSFYTSDFLLERASVGFEKNDIKDLTKITNIFLPRFINKQLKKVFEKGILDGEFIIPFNSDGSINKKYTFYGSVKEANLNFLNNYKIKNLNAKIIYGKTANIDADGIKIIIQKASISNLNLLESFIDIKFKKNKKHINSTLRTSGDVNFSDIKKILSLLGVTIENLQDIALESNLTTNIQFDLNNRYKIKNANYSIEGDINRLQFKINKKSPISKFLPSFNQNIIIKPAKVSFSSNHREENFRLEGHVNFSKDFEKLKIVTLHNKINNKRTFKLSSSLTESSVNIEKLNYKKKIGKEAKIDFDLDVIPDKHFLLKSFLYSDNKSQILLNKLKLNKNLEIMDLSDLKIKTYLKSVINNDFLIKKSNKTIISGKVLDIQPLLKSLFKNDDKKTFSNKFNTDLKINIQKTITGTGDDVSDLSMIAAIREGSYNKLSLKGNFSEDEIVEMSIYQEDKDKKTVQIISDRARPFIMNFDFIEGFDGGKLEYESNIINKKSFSNLLITDFKVSKVPALAQLLTLASFQGIADTLNGEGIRFESFEMKSYTEGNVMNIEDALAIGPAVSILLSGYVDKGNIVSLRGTLVPATKLNSIIASIPVVGDILVGTKTGEGVVGVSFKMKGPPKNIKTSVNPIKTLTPRFIVRAVEKMKKEKKEEAK
jgi:hypothetical protein